MLTGAYSSLFVASPLLGWLKTRSARFAGRTHGTDAHLVGEELRAVVVGGVASVRAPSGRRRAMRATPDEPAGKGTSPAEAPVAPHAVPADRLLSHPPRPRKKKKR
jgi:preprotein translocase subunit SecF